MKVFSVVLLIGLVAALSEGRYNEFSAGRSVGSGTNVLNDMITKGPKAIQAFAKNFGIDTHVVLEELDYWIKFVEPFVEPAALKNKIKQVVDLLDKAAQILGVGGITDFSKITRVLQDKLVPNVQVALKVVKIVRSTLQSLKL